jgi:hypothetical protein
MFDNIQGSKRILLIILIIITILVVAHIAMSHWKPEGLSISPSNGTFEGIYLNTIGRKTTF